MTNRTALLVAAACLSPAALAQDELPFPADVTVHDRASGVLEFQPRRTELELLTTLDAVTLTGFPMPDGTAVDLALYRNPIELKNYGLFVDGQPTQYDPKDQTLWNGHVVGNESSHVQLCLASYGCYGWVFDGGQYTHVSSFPGEFGGWANAGGRVFSDAALQRVAGPRAQLSCGADQLPDNTMRQQLDAVLPASGGDIAGQQLLDLRMAIESDHQYYQNWGNLQACQNYTIALLDAASDRYESQIGVVLTYPYLQFHTNANDGWDSQDSGGGCGDVLTEFANAWGGGNMPLDAHLGHFLSGANLGCGVAWLNVICNPNNGFAVSGNMTGGVSFPVSPGSNTWDFVVFTHETGHNCGASHTHDYCPPIDTCYSNCTGSTSCPTGTNMSYCHLCGGMSNITTYFDNQIVNIIRGRAEASCIPNYDTRQEVVLFEDDFESGMMDPAWSTQRAKVRAQADYLSSFGVRIRKKGNASITVNTTGYDGVKLYFARRTKNYDAGEDFQIRYKIGTGSWKTIESTTQIHWGLIAAELPAEVDNKTSVTFRFKSNGSEGKERGDIDNVIITGRQ